jgi:hypothetical protein
MRCGGTTASRAIGGLNTTGGSTAYSTSISVPACAAWSRDLELGADARDRSSH